MSLPIANSTLSNNPDVTLESINKGTHYRNAFLNLLYTSHDSVKPLYYYFYFSVIPSKNKTNEFSFLLLALLTFLTNNSNKAPLI